jgi:hypothetical protein
MLLAEGASLACSRGYQTGSGWGACLDIEIHAIRNGALAGSGGAPEVRISYPRSPEKLAKKNASWDLKETVLVCQKAK